MAERADREPGASSQREERAGQDVEHPEGEGGSGTSESQATVPPLRSIEYNPALLEYTDPFGSMKPDVYTDVVPTRKRPSLLPSASPYPVDPLQVMCDSIFKIVQSSVRTATEAQAESTVNTGTYYAANLFKNFPYFDITLETSDGALVPANRIFLARCPNGFEFLSCGRNNILVPLTYDSVVKVLRVLYSTDSQWLVPPDLDPEEYTNFAGLFGDLAEPGNKFRSLPDHLETFVCSNLLSDACIRSNNFKTPVHKVILCGRSDYFAKAFSPYFLASRTGETELNDTSSPVIVALLDYLYTGRVDKATSLELVVDILTVANEIQDEVLCEVCCQAVGSNIDLDNCCSLYCMSRQLSQPELQWYCTQFILEHFHSINPSIPGYTSLPSSALEELDLMYEVLVLNPVGRGGGFGSIREVIGTLREACFSMDERLEEAQKAHAKAIQSGASSQESEHSLRRLQMQEGRVKRLHKFLSIVTWRYQKLISTLEES